MNFAIHDIWLFNFFDLLIASCHAYTLNIIVDVMCYISWTFHFYVCDLPSWLMYDILKNVIVVAVVVVVTVMVMVTVVVTVTVTVSVINYNSTL